MRKTSRVPRLVGPIRVGLANLLQDEILSGRIAPGSRIQQLDLARRLKLSQSAVREALQELEHRGLLRKRGRSWEVTRLSDGELVDHFQVRALLEPFACRLAAFHWTEEATRRLEDCVSRMEEAARLADYAMHWAADVDYHLTIWEVQPNRCLEQLLKTVSLPVFANGLLRHAAIPPESYRRSLRWHLLLLRLLRVRDGIAAERAARRAVREFLALNLKDFGG